MTMQWLVKRNINVNEYVKVKLSPCLIEENAMKLNGRVDEQHFEFCSSSRDTGAWPDLWPVHLNIETTDAVHH